MKAPTDTNLLERIEVYLDTEPRFATDAEAVGKFTLFRPLGPWKYYARPRLGLDEPIGRGDVDILRSRQRELSLGEKIEWVMQTTPSLAHAARASGLTVHEYPMLLLDHGAFAPIPTPDGIEIRLVDADEVQFAAAHAVADVGFGVAGTHIGSVGTKERDEKAAAFKPEEIEFMRDRARRNLSISFAAFGETGPVCVGTYQPVDGVTEIVGIATLPSARRRGIASALTAAIVQDAFSRGVTTIFMGADSDDVARIYEGVGFARIGSLGAAELPK